MKKVTGNCQIFTISNGILQFCKRKLNLFGILGHQGLSFSYFRNSVVLCWEAMDIFSWEQTYNTRGAANWANWQQQDDTRVIADPRVNYQRDGNHSFENHRYVLNNHCEHFMAIDTDSSLWNHIHVTTKYIVSFGPPTLTKVTGEVMVKRAWSTQMTKWQWMLWSRPYDPHNAIWVPREFMWQAINRKVVCTSQAIGFCSFVWTFRSRHITTWWQ